MVKIIFISALVILLLIAILVIILINRRSIPFPLVRWEKFESLNSPANAGYRESIEGLYRISGGNNIFGDSAVAKWSHIRMGNDTVHHLSIFCEKEGAVIICEARMADGIILLRGFWRDLKSNYTGPVHIEAIPAPGKSVIRGHWGHGRNKPSRSLEMEFLRPLNSRNDFLIIGHRGGGRNAERLPASENSVEMVMLAERLGANGVEIDVRSTSDAMPVAYHDPTINIRLVKGRSFPGKPVQEYTFDQLRRMKLKNGERIPSIREILEVILNHTSLHFVWLDVKQEQALPALISLQREFMEKAAGQGRQIDILIGIADDIILQEFVSIPGHRQIPSLAEGDPEQARRINAAVWAPQWTEGILKEEAAAMQQEGRRVLVWTVDDGTEIRKYKQDGGYDGVVTNICPVAAFRHFSD